MMPHVHLPCPLPRCGQFACTAVHPFPICVALIERHIATAHTAREVGEWMMIWPLQLAIMLAIRGRR